MSCMELRISAGAEVGYDLLGTPPYGIEACSYRTVVPNYVCDAMEFDNRRLDVQSVASFHRCIKGEVREFMH